MPLEVVTPEFVEKLLDLAVENYDVVLVDLPTAWVGWSLSAFQRSDAICLVTELSVPGVHQASARSIFWRPMALASDCGCCSTGWRRRCSVALMSPAPKPPCGARSTIPSQTTFRPSVRRWTKESRCRVSRSSPSVERDLRQLIKALTIGSLRSRPSRYDLADPARHRRSGDHHDAAGGRTRRQARTYRGCGRDARTRGRNKRSTAQADAEARKADLYTDLKVQMHQKLIERINLSALETMSARTGWPRYR